MSSAYAIAPHDAIVDSIQIDGQWKPLCMPVRVDSGQVVNVVGDTAYLYTPHVCESVSIWMCVAFVLAAFAAGSICTWFMMRRCAIVIND